MRVIVDVDTASELGDAFAVVRALIEPRFRMVGLTSAHSLRGSDGGPAGIAGSQRLNERLLELLGRPDVPHPAGAEAPLVDPSTPSDSPAARHIVAAALDTPPGEKLSVIACGPVTNVASAILLDARIVPKLRCYLVGFQYDDRAGAWSAEEFNVKSDPAAAEVLLATDRLELHVLPATVAEKLLLRKAVVRSGLEGKGGVWDFLVDHWAERQPHSRWWVMWDLALVEAVARPELALEVRAAGPSGDRLIHIYTELDHSQARLDFWNAVTLARFRLPGE